MKGTYSEIHIKVTNESYKTRFDSKLSGLKLYTDIKTNYKVYILPKIIPPKYLSGTDCLFFELDMIFLLYFLSGQCNKGLYHPPAKKQTIKKKPTDRMR